MDDLEGNDFEVRVEGEVGDNVVGDQPRSDGLVVNSCKWNSLETQKIKK